MKKTYKTFSGKPPSQHPEEIKKYKKLLEKEGIRSFLEIGSRHGDNFYDIMTSLPPGSLGVAVDLPDSLWGRIDSQESLERCVQELRKQGYNAHVIFGNSQTDEMVEKVKEIAEEFECVFIDGDHTYDGAKRDFELYLPLAGELVTFHDIVGVGQKDKRYDAKVEVPILWQELKQHYNHVEIVGQGSIMGIGVLELFTRIK